MAGTITLWVFGLLCFVVAFAKEAASGAGISLPGPKTGGARFGVIAVGVLALILGTAIRPTGDAPAGSAPVAGTAASTQGSVPPAPATTTSTAAPAPPAPSPTGLTVAWTGQVGISMEGGIDFDLTPPSRHPGFPQGIYATGFTATTAVLREEIQSEHDSFGIWTGQTPPSGAACADWAASHSGDSAHVNVGSLVCLKSPGGRTALIRIDSIAPADYQVEATVTVWSG
ncbi:hypothetical protein [Kitasatospora cathayae]|uniref:Serine/threonine protein kinase n=1 Tax=Kitasatospora cathayae TaxID=3004092 RepID=A0ABY7PXX1_9ACTN|nr:hypothetical protein [Kitasatospora sp. HUAS 3-15]WBP85278.1 hypothetical protein O1G21_04995 [Kitasatospora sp. HUAS 3-15]